MKHTLIDLWRSSALIHGLLALLFGGTAVYLALMDMSMPDVLVGTLMAIVILYLGADLHTTT